MDMPFTGVAEIDVRILPSQPVIPAYAGMTKKVFQIFSKPTSVIFTLNG
jgi:hypothetical protein